ncbi:MAG: AAA family ATPase [Clostridia bacterium]|nr:AAA family ATPase [Clostridia bacterium]
MKRNGGGKFNIALVLLIIFIVGVFALFVAALITQYAVYGGKFPSIGAEIKYVFIAFIIALPVLLVFLLIAAFSKKRDCSLVTPQYFGVDFEKEVQNKPKLKDMCGATVKPDVLQSFARVGADLSEASQQLKESEENGSRFYMLTEIDKEYETYERPEYDEEITLKELCEEFRNFSAGELKLYYDIEDIRRFIGAMAVTKLIILQGMSGTGKTSLAYAFGEFLDNKTVVVPIQPMWKERTDLVGYYNEFTKKFNETTLLYKMYEANNNEEIYITVLDEMNIARVEYYFAEFLSLLEIPNPDGRNLDVVADRREDDPKLLQHNGKLRLPTNMWFVGTANNDDSTFSISDKVYDRAMVLNLDKKAIPFEAKGKSKKISATHLEELMQKAQREYGISDRNMRRIKKLDEYMIKTFHITFGNRIMKQIKSYVPVLAACGGTELEAMDDILARKVFRKLESKNPVYVKQMADGVCNYLDELFGENKLPLCKETIRLIELNV